MGYPTSLYLMGALSMMVVTKLSYKAAILPAVKS